VQEKENTALARIPPGKPGKNIEIGPNTKDCAIKYKHEYIKGEIEIM
jgi:hypothetical protein